MQYGRESTLEYTLHPQPTLVFRGKAPHPHTPCACPCRPLHSRNAKVIPLHLGFCTCRSLRNKDLSVNSKGSGGVAYSGNLGARSGGAGASGRGGVDGGGGSGGGGGGGGGGGVGGNKHLLEIEVVGSKRRVWAAENKQECRRWVSVEAGLASSTKS